MLPPSFFPDRNSPRHIGFNLKTEEFYSMCLERLGGADDDGLHRLTINERGKLQTLAQLRGEVNNRADGRPWPYRGGRAAINYFYSRIIAPTLSVPAVPRRF